MSDVWGDPEESDEEELDLDEEDSELPAEEEPARPPPMPPLRRHDAPIPDSTPIPMTPTDPQPDMMQVVAESPQATVLGILSGTGLVAFAVIVDVFNLIAPAAGVIQSLPDEP